MEIEENNNGKKLGVILIIVILLLSGVAMFGLNSSNPVEENYDQTLMSGDNFTVYCWSDRDQDVLWAFKENMQIPEGYVIKVDMTSISNCTNPAQKLNFTETDFFNTTNETVEDTTTTTIKVI